MTIKKQREEILKLYSVEALLELWNKYKHLGHICKEINLEYNKYRKGLSSIYVDENIDTRKGKIVWNKGLDLTDPRLIKLRDSRKETLGNWSQEQKLDFANKISVTRKERIKSGLIDITKNHQLALNAWRGSHHTKETKKIMSDQKLGDLNPCKREEVREKIRLKRLLQVFPTKDTSIEVKIQEELNKRNIQFVTHKSILGQPDIFIEPNICIFLDGCYWHVCTECKIKVSENIIVGAKRDNTITKYLVAQNYKVLRFWEHEINSNLDGVVNKILSVIKGE